uniref:Uncharacterized protein n=1 Tax=Cyanothece sp. (strain PCC 7425 / ATCC 29141) TaxID=395961 RepID=B8HP35_CYAP4
MSETVPQTLEDVKNRIGSLTDQATNALNGAANHAVNQLDAASSAMTQTAERTRLALDETLQQAEHLSGTLTTNLQQILADSVRGWMSEHPLIAWMIHHPLWTLVLILLGLFLSWGLVGAAAQLTKKVWVLVLQGPFKLAQLLAQGILRLFNLAKPPQLAQLEREDHLQKRLSEILNRLESLRQEQEALIREMELLVLSKR